MDATNKFEYEIEVLDRPGMTQSEGDISMLKSRLCQLGHLCFDPLPNYQVFEHSSKTSFHDKIIVLAKQNDEPIAFLSAVVLSISGLEDPVVHTGLTVIHPSHRKSGVIHRLFANLVLHIFSIYPNGLWLSTLSGIVTSLGHIATYTSEVFPSPQWNEEHPSGLPSHTHLHIAREINAKHRHKMLIPPEAHFDESSFVFRASKPTLSASSPLEEASVSRQDHRNLNLTKFYRGLLRDPGDEVLQVSYFKPEFTFNTGADVLAKASNTVSSFSRELRLIVPALREMQTVNRQGFTHSGAFNTRRSAKVSSHRSSGKWGLPGSTWLLAAEIQGIGKQNRERGNKRSNGKACNCDEMQNRSASHE